MGLPEGWRLVRSWGPRPFRTHALLEDTDGRQVEWSSRRNRKSLGLRPPEGRRLGDLERRWGGRPARSSWWMGSLFMVGASCFALGSLPLFFDRADAPVVAATFFVGSVFFTSAAALQYREAAVAPTSVDPVAPRPRGLRGLLGWNPRRIDWWAAIIQLVGTVFFNVSTFAATRADLSLERQKHLIWAPDIGGSICFLLASWLAYAEVNRGVWPRSDRSVGWGISALNLVGSLAFGAAAIAARYLPGTGEPANIALVNLGTFVGAVCFFVGAALLPVESAKDRSPT